jgi:hypothetical protein
MDIRKAMEEAKSVLQWSSLTGTACAMWERLHETGDEPTSMYETCKDQGRRSILDDFFGDHGATAYEAISSEFFQNATMTPSLISVFRCSRPRSEGPRGLF